MERNARILGFKLSRTKTEYMECKFSSRSQISNELVTIAGERNSTNKQIYY